MFNIQIAISQSFLNGSFETTTSTGCNYNMNNATYNSLMPNSNAFGSYQALDIVVSGCYIPSVPDGIYAVNIANNPPNNIQGEAISLELSIPLIMGNSYTISFEALALTSFGPQGDLLIGASTTNSTFGAAIYTANTVNSGWITFTFTFVAPNNSSNITVMPVSGISSWNSIDNFVIINPLPIELKDFTASLISKGSVLLEWSTASELNNDYFEIERSISGVDWKTISKVDGAGNSNHLLNYRTTDVNSYSGISYYRLKQTNFDGQSSFSNIKAIENDKLEGSQIKIYPNPTSNLLTIEGDKVELEQFKIYNVLGQDITALTPQNSAIESKIVIDLANLINGIYYIKTKTTINKVFKN